MQFLSLRICAAATVFMIGFLTNTSTATATSLAKLGTFKIAKSKLVHDINHRRKKRRYRRRYYNDGHVDAPYTYVDTYAGDVAVDAPYTTVRRTRRGVRVRAPYVDLYVPY